MIMERKIGEIFEYNGEWYQCIVGNDCENCAFNERKCYTVVDNGDPIGDCCADRRKDNKDVIFKKLEKVGEPHFIEDEIFEDGKVYVQNFEVYKDFEGHKPMCNDYIIYDWKNRILSIEIKQNKEDMSNTETLWYGPDKKEAKSLKLSNLKPFSLEAAKAGKPVCTKDGRKARIICFDRNDLYPIVALIECEDGKERIGAYSKQGQTEIYEIKGTDLMMLPEKKEGWINIIKTEDGGYCCKGEVHSDYNDAFFENINALDNRGITVKIEWED